MPDMPGMCGMLGMCGLCGAPSVPCGWLHCHFAGTVGRSCSACRGFLHCL